MRFSMPSKLRKLITSSFFPAKILAKAIRKNGDISDLFIKDIEFKISKYADDKPSSLMAQKNHFLKPWKLWNAQCKASGLRHNNKKTEAFWTGSFVGKPGSLSIQPKFSKIWKQRQMVLEIRGAKLNEKETSGKKFQKFGYTARGCPLYSKFWKMPFHSLLYIPDARPSRPILAVKKNHLYSSPEAEYSSTYRPAGLLYFGELILPRTLCQLTVYWHPQDHGVPGQKNVYIKDHPCFYPQK